MALRYCIASYLVYVIVQDVIFKELWKQFVIWPVLLPCCGAFSFRANINCDISMLIREQLFIILKRCDFVLFVEVRGCFNNLRHRIQVPRYLKQNVH